MKAMVRSCGFRHPWMNDWSECRQVAWSRLRAAIHEYGRSVGWGLTPEQFGSYIKANEKAEG